MLELQAADPNQDAYDDLLAAIETSDDQLALLIAVCDDPAQRQAIIQRYETDLADSHQTYRLSMARSDPSLKLAIQELIAADSWQPDRRAVITVLDIERLSFWSQGEEKSPQEVFFGYLQWTREALREFRYPIVIWVTYQILSRLSRKSPDFWGWRKGVFRFVSRTKAAIPAGEIEAIRDLGLAQISEDTLLPLADLEALIQQTEAQTPNSPLLASLYQQLARVYQTRLDRGEAANYPSEAAKAIRYFEKAIALQTDLDLPLDLATSLNNLAELYRVQGRYADAEALYLRALDIRERQLGAEHPDVATSLNNLAELYESQGRYADAEALLLRALDIRERQLGAEHPDVATSLNNLALLYESQGRYADAEPLYLRDLEISERQLGAEHPDVATSLNNLAELYRVQGRYAEAESLYLRALDIKERQLGAEHPDVATSLNNLALLDNSQGRYAEAESLLLRALDIWERQLGAEHPDVATSLNNLAALYRAQGRYAEAEPLYLRALSILFKTLGEHHPNTQVIQSNFRRLLQQAVEAGQAAQLSDHPLTQAGLAELRVEEQ